MDVSKFSLAEMFSRKDWHGAEVVYADLWQSVGHLDSSYTSFRAGVHLQWNGQRYRIIEPRFRNANDFWRELEIKISNSIVINE